MINKSIQTTGILLVAIALLVGCESQPRDSVELGSEESFDGLRVVKDTSVHRVWVREGLDLSRYNSLMLQGAGIKFRPVDDPSTSVARSSTRVFPVTPQNQERLREIARESFTQALKDSESYEFVEEAGPGVLLVEGALIDVVSFVPPDPIGRGDVFLSRIGEATLVIQVSDSESKAVLARIIDRRAADPVTMQRSTTPANLAEVRRVMNNWARQLRLGLDTLHDHVPQ